VAPLLAEADFSFEFKEPQNIPNPMLTIQGGSFGYSQEDAPPKMILRGVNRSVLAGQRIGILGANGQGKSTLVKTIARTMGALDGTVTEGKGLSIGYFAQQELDVLHPASNPLEHMVRLARDLGANAPQRSTEQDLRGYLGSFNFSGDMVKQAVGTMSGGEKARLVLAMMVWQRPNLLLMDEPTNHLDLATREALSVALNEFEGTLMLVSHDRALLRAVCDEFWLVGRGGVTDFDGDLDDYQRYLLDESKRLREAARVAAATAQAEAPAAAPVPAPAALPEAAPSAPPVSGREQRQQEAAARQKAAEQRRPLQRELERVEARLGPAGDERDALHAQLAQNPGTQDIAEAGRRLKALEDEIAQLEENWMRLSEQLQKMEK